MDGDAFEIRGRLGVGDDWIDRWPTLSHGERKRAQIAVALWRKPNVLAVDEPTNHLDVDAQDMLFNALSTFHGVGILVSHDQRFLDTLARESWHISAEKGKTGTSRRRIDEISQLSIHSETADYP